MGVRRISVRYVRSPVDWHRFKNFGEAVVGEIKRQGIGCADWAQIDAPQDYFEVNVTKQELGDALRIVRALAKKHMIESELDISARKAAADLV